MKMARDWAFPDADRFMVGELGCDGTYQIANLRAALRHVSNHGLGIDAGAHIGTWSKVMSAHFERVVAFEPSPDTFEALLCNMQGFACLNVECLNVALGSGKGWVSMMLDPEQERRANTGARFVRPSARGTIPVVTIDSYAFDRVGFIKLDIEGSELEALRGAKDTLTRCQPIVLYENKKLWTRHYGLAKGVVEVFLKAHGYHFLEQAGNDVIWGPA